MTDNRTTELLPCPFCGGEAEIKRYQSGDWQVICYHADGCIMLESDLDNCYWENVQTLARQWNTRAERTCKREKHGRKMDGSWRMRCSECGYGIGDKRWNFCPKCGAKVAD